MRVAISSHYSQSIKHVHLETSVESAPEGGQGSGSLAGRLVALLCLQIVREETAPYQLLTIETYIRSNSLLNFSAKLN